MLPPAGRWAAGTRPQRLSRAHWLSLRASRNPFLYSLVEAANPPSRTMECMVRLVTMRKPWAGLRTCPAGHLHDQAAAGVLHDVASVDGQRGQAEDGVARLIRSKIDQRAERVACSPVVHVGHHCAQVRKLRLLHLSARTTPFKAGACMQRPRPSSAASRT